MTRRLITAVVCILTLNYLHGQHPSDNDQVVIRKSPKNWTMNELKESERSYYRNQHFRQGDDSFILEADSLALVDFYVANGEQGWLNWLVGPVSTWSGIQVENGRVVSFTALFQISVFTVSLTRLDELSFLDFFNNNLTSIPVEIGNLSKLEYLDLSINALTTIPKEVGNLHQLTYLNLWANSITEVPVETGGLGRLEYLDLDGNLLETVPDAISSITSLKKLYLSGNFLTSLPDLSNLENIEWLFLNGNYLDFDDLRSVNLDFNQIDWVIYAPQQPFGYPSQNDDHEIRILSFDQGDNVNYQWHKYPEIAMEGETDSIISLTDQDQGLYYCETSDPEFPELHISSGLIGRNSGLIELIYEDEEANTGQGAQIGKLIRGRGIDRNFFRGNYVSTVTYERIGEILFDEVDFEKTLEVVGVNTCRTFLGPFESIVNLPDPFIWITIEEDNTVEIEIDPSTSEWSAHDIDWGTSYFDPETGDIYLYYGYTVPDSGERKFKEVLTYNGISRLSFELGHNMGNYLADNDKFILENNSLKTIIDLGTTGRNSFQVFVEIFDPIYGVTYLEEFILEFPHLLNADISHETINIFPNPTDGPLKFDRRVNDLVIRDPSGKVLLARKELGVDQFVNLNEYRAGLYFITFKVEGINHFKKLILRH